MKKMLKIILGFLGVFLILTLINFIPLLSLKTMKMNEYTIQGITVFAEEKDFKNAESIVVRISESSKRVTDALGFTNEQPIKVIIYPNRKALHLKTLGFAGWFLPDWYIGKNTIDYVLITSPSEPGPQHNRESIEKAAVHEYVHAMTDRKNRTMGYWMKEGFALYLADQNPEKISIRNESDITFDEYKTQNPMEFANVGGYILAYNYMEYLEREFGWEKVLGFLDSNKSFEDVIGKKEELIFKQWKSELKEL
ncbi:MAG: hypothetical protein PF518_16120 [Spirochaetaceae bacterium]|nr:hypothetical protein [Spirochaetaceae bacterium]